MNFRIITTLFFVTIVNCAIVQNPANLTRDGTDFENADAAESLLLKPLVRLNLLNQSLDGIDDAYSFENYDGEHWKRTDVKSCVESVTNVENHFSSGDEATMLWYNAIDAVAGSIHAQSQNHYCGEVGGVIAGGHMRYKYKGSGKNCASTAGEFTIRGSLDKAFRQFIISQSWKVYCLELTHGGDWHGYLLIGPNVNWPAGLSCGGLNSGRCVSGGVNDAHHK